MKRILSTGLSLILFALAGLFAFSSCDKNTAPTDNWSFVGTYEGSVKFLDINLKPGDTNVVSKTATKCTVLKTGDTYTFSFNEKVPDIVGLKFKKDKDSFLSLSDTEVGAIKVTKDNLTIAFKNEKGSWAGSMKRK